MPGKEKSVFSGRLSGACATLLVALAAGAASAGEDAGRSGNYLIVTAGDYVNSAPLNQFITHKTNMGFNVAVYHVPSGTARTAIKTYIQSLYAVPETRPQYLLIVGDTDGSSATSNTIPHWVGSGSRHATTDLPYTCMGTGDDWYPEFPVGRFSVRTTTQLQAVVDKTIFVETGSFGDPTYAKRAAFLATNDTTADAEVLHDYIIATYMAPNEYESTKVYARLGGDAGDITEAVNRGCVFTVYFGHSDDGGWWAPSFDSGDVQSLSNAGLYGLVFGFSCNTAHFDYSECFGETWLRVPNKGAAAYLSASNYIWWSSYSDWESSRRMEKYFFRAFFERDIWEIGPAWLSACYALLADPAYGPSHDHTRNIFEEFVILGDPSLRLPKGDGFSLRIGPMSRDLCAPPANETTYVIEVEQHGDFNEVVTLSAAGAPPGATVDFSVNGQTPPFSSVLTLGNLTGGSPGHYAIEIEGTSATKEDMKIVNLYLSDAAPGTVVLTSPPNGAVDVPKRPTLDWQAASQTSTYYLQIATDPGFSNVVYSASGTQPSHTVSSDLGTDSTYYWRVRAVNGCGDSGFTAPFSFTTVAIVNYFTEEFPSGAGWDMNGLKVVWRPVGSGNFYDECTESISALPTDPAGSAHFSIGDDDFKQVVLGDSRTVQLYGLAYPTFYVGSNGFITFTAGDDNWQVSVDSHFNLPRVSAMYADLDPTAAGWIGWKQLSDRVAVTWSGVPMWGTGNYITMQVEMFWNGEIHVSWLSTATKTAIAGLSEGNGTPSDYVETDLSAALGCTHAGDLNCDGSCDGGDVAPFVLALLDPMGYESAYPECDMMNGDMNGSDSVDGDDIAAFVEAVLP